MSSLLKRTEKHSNFSLYFILFRCVRFCLDKHIKQKKNNFSILNCH
jgi:hypothetical protein